jgi:nanoRNase/pAp phosphatase (c-di-AMP/oligoRNAs hydrolase)
MSKEHLEQLAKTVDNLDSVLILPHNDPDPDAIASAFGLGCLLTEWLNITAQIAYKGIIGRAENRTLVRYLGNSLQRLSGQQLENSTAIALVDTQPGAGNNPVPDGTGAAIVIDHHPWQEATAKADFADVRPEIGAAATILTEYLLAANLEPDPVLATVLFYGIKTDTKGLGRNAAQADVEAYAYLQSRIDIEALAEIEYAQVPSNYFKSFDLALRAARMYQNVIIAYMGQMDYPDLTAEMADMLLRLEGCQWVICMGVYENVLILSVRTRSPQGGAGQLVRAIVGQEGTAGGHGTMAGGHIDLRDRNPTQIVEKLRQRILKHLNLPSKGRSLL